MKLKRPHMQIKKNKNRGIKREEKAIEWLKSWGYIILERKSSNSSYDFLIAKIGEKLLIEHKSCLDKIYSAAKNYPNRVIAGRFKIILENHNEMPMIAEEKSAKPFYLFQLVYKNNNIFIMKNWKEVDNIIKRLSRFYFVPIKMVINEKN